MYWAQWDSLRLQDGVVYQLWEMPAGDSTVRQLLLPKKFRADADADADVLCQLHDSKTAGHLGSSKTLKTV